MAKKRKPKSKDAFDDVVDVAVMGAKTTIAVGAVGSILGSLKK